MMQIADPLYGEWFDVFVKLLQPLTPPVTGILGEATALSVLPQNSCGFVHAHVGRCVARR